jgi:hypothetical protein
MSFDPTIGRWMQADPDLYIDGANVYQMEKGSPEDGLDPTGLFDGPIYPIHTGGSSVLTTPAAGPANPGAYLYDQGAGVAHPGATPYTQEGKNGTWTALAFATWGTWASDCGLRFQLTYKPKGDMWDCDEIDIIQFTQVIDNKSGNSVPLMDDSGKVRSNANGWGIDSDGKASTPYITQTAGAFNWPYQLPAHDTAQFEDDPHPDDLSGKKTFNFVDIAVVTKGKSLGYVLDAVQWGFIYDPDLGILPRQNFDNKTMIAPAPAWSQDVGEAINLWNGKGSIVPFAWNRATK